jgi:hypothetical protein
VTTTTRLEVLPEVGTVGEFVRGYEATTWLGFGTPKNTPAAVVDWLDREINSAIADLVIRGRLVDIGGLVQPPNSPADFAKLIATETEKAAGVIRSAVRGSLQCEIFRRLMTARGHEGPIRAAPNLSIRVRSTPIATGGLAAKNARNCSLTHQARRS